MANIYAIKATNDTLRVRHFIGHDAVKAHNRHLCAGGNSDGVIKESLSTQCKQGKVVIGFPLNPK